jgi:hypothetical protein
MSKKKTPAATLAKPTAAKKANTAPQGADFAPAKGKATTKPTPVGASQDQEDAQGQRTCPAASTRPGR